MDAIKIVLLCAALSGCSQIAYVKGKIVDGVDGYCRNVSPLERQAIRDEVTAALAEKGHEIRVTCAVDK